MGRVNSALSIIGPNSALVMYVVNSEYSGQPAKQSSLDLGKPLQRTWKYTNPPRSANGGLPIFGSFRKCALGTSPLTCVTLRPKSVSNTSVTFPDFVMFVAPHKWNTSTASGVGFGI